MVEVKNFDELKIAAQKFCDSIGNDRVFLFYGEMGAGKTTFIKEICKVLGIKSEVTSPTFAILNEYPCEKFGFVYHFDFYRIDKITEIFDIGFEEYLESGALLFIEWPEKLGPLTPENARKIFISIEENACRLITW
ncbi:MAG: tRNA (adenosine(37)-N6)-threonylcarbamoyltransferase complex ATPase subunit type 1 TsaE [Bacteroidales bacterium]|jgi:tRNA threonylcarbamoyladenosine biosynthesis protein TsaE|nr:tRNA (adenosine(37)-N6)-threonylcarbamoyltransferase complex ATPase subunit type 1 TsaE [Bacteroidales bacterium]